VQFVGELSEDSIFGARTDAQMAAVAGKNCEDTSEPFVKPVVSAEEENRAQQNLNSKATMAAAVATHINGTFLAPESEDDVVGVRSGAQKGANVLNLLVSIKADADLALTLFERVDDKVIRVNLLNFKMCLAQAVEAHIESDPKVMDSQTAADVSLGIIGRTR